jgi:MFS family permease
MIAIKDAIPRSIGFIRRQTRNFKIMLVRRALHGIASNLSMQFNSIYATALGADPVQLGSLQSVGNAIGAIVSVPAGWLIDNYSMKKVFLLGTVFLGASAALYLSASHWTYLYAAIILYYMGVRITCVSCTVTCATELPNDERATGRGLCRTLSSIVALSTPMLAAWIVSLSGGINVAGMRPIYAIQIVLFVTILGLLVKWLREPALLRGSHANRPRLSDFAGVFKQSPDVMRMMLMIALMETPWAMAQPFMPLFAHQEKMANEFVLGGIATSLSVLPMLVSIPLGRLADRYGRKKLLFALTPAVYLAYLFLILANGNTMLIVSGLFFGFTSISMAIASAMTAEIMPRGQMGRWIGMVSLIRGLISIPAPMLGGLIWDHVGPQYVFIAAIAIDLFVRVPLLASIRETLHLQVDQSDLDADTRD